MSEIMSELAETFSPLSRPTVFFSSQNETGMREGRRFIERALQRALDELRQNGGPDAVLITGDLRQKKPHEERAVDLKAHFAHLDTATLVVADLTAVARTRNGRRVPSPEVMRDLGWALAKLGDEGVVTVAHAARESAFPAEIVYDIAHSGEAQHAFHELVAKFKDALTRRL